MNTFIPNLNNVKPLGRTMPLPDSLWLAFSGSGAAFVFTGRHCEVTVAGDSNTRPGDRANAARIAIEVNGKRVVDDLIDLQEKEEAQKKNEGKQESRYVSSLIDDLKAKMSKEDEDKREEEEAYRQIYESIRKTYPYLSNGFIRNVYELKESIASEYPEEENIIILHRTVFRNVENLRQYVEIALKHGYLINADEKKMIVDAMKAYVNSDGKIITSIFEVANQSALLNGEYEGYRVLFEDDL